MISIMFHTQNSNTTSDQTLDQLILGILDGWILFDLDSSRTNA